MPVSIEYGITDNWQVKFEWDAHVNRNPEEEVTARGIGDLQIGTKYSFMDIAGQDLHAAVGFEIGFPTGDINKELTEGFIEYEPFVVLAKDFPSLNNSQVFTQLGIGFVSREERHADPDEDEPEAHEFNWSVGFFVPVGPVRLVSEFNGTTNEWNNQGD